MTDSNDMEKGMRRSEVRDYHVLDENFNVISTKLTVGEMLDRARNDDFLPYETIVESQDTGYMNVELMFCNLESDVNELFFIRTVSNNSLASDYSSEHFSTYKDAKAVFDDAVASHVAHSASLEAIFADFVMANSIFCERHNMEEHFRLADGETLDHIREWTAENLPGTRWEEHHYGTAIMFPSADGPVLFKLRWL